MGVAGGSKAQRTGEGEGRPYAHRAFHDTPTTKWASNAREEPTEKWPAIVGGGPPALRRGRSPSRLRSRPASPEEDGGAVRQHGHGRRGPEKGRGRRLRDHHRPHTPRPLPRRHLEAPPSARTVRASPTHPGAGARGSTPRADALQRPIGAEGAPGTTSGRGRRLPPPASCPRRTLATSSRRPTSPPLAAITRPRLSSGAPTAPSSLRTRTRHSPHGRVGGCRTGGRGPSHLVRRGG